jgi:hypothetical protein
MEIRFVHAPQVFAGDFCLTGYPGRIGDYV